MLAQRSGRDGVRASGARIEELLASFDRPQPPATTRARAEELVRELVSLYGAGLERLLEIIDESAGDGVRDRLFATIGDDRLVSGLLAIHNLHPLTAIERAQRALEAVRPYIESHKGKVEILSVEDGVVTVRMSGSCNGCPSSEVTLKLALERAILEACPDVTEVRADNVASEAVDPALLPTVLCVGSVT